MNIRRRVAAFSILTIAAVLLVGCTPEAPVSRPTSSSSVSAPAPTPSATPTPVPPAAPVIDEFVLRPEYAELWSGGEVVETLDYMSSSEAAIARLSTLFGRAPEQSTYEGGNHHPDGTQYTWGLVTLQVESLTDGWEVYGRSLVYPEFSLFFDGPSEGTVGLRAANGARAGSPWADLATVAPAEGFIICNDALVERVRANTPGGYGGAVVSARQDWENPELVKWIQAPDVETDGCA